MTSSFVGNPMDENPVLIVSPLHHADRIATQRRPSHLVSLLSPGHPAIDSAPKAAEHYLQLLFHDITEERPGLIAPDRTMVNALLDFGRTWNTAAPMLIHCWAGISRSSAAAFILACDLNEGVEHDIARALRDCAPFVTPNRLMVALADDILARGGRMIDAIDGIGRGAEAFAGEPFEFPTRWPSAPR